METIEQKRAKILKKRLDLLNSYLVAEYIDARTGKSFADFLKWKGITRKAFIKDLPTLLQNPPAGGYKELMTYAASMNQLLVNQYLSALQNAEPLMHNAVEEIAGQQAQLEGAVVDPDTVYWANGGEDKDDHPCRCGGKCGGDKSKENDIIRYPKGNLTEVVLGPGEHLPESGIPLLTYDGLNFNASGGCGLPPIPPPVPNIGPGQKLWNAYNEKKNKYNACRKAQKAGGEKLSMHLLHLSNPMEAIGRGAFLKLIEWNVFGLAQIFNQIKAYPDQSWWEKIKAKWYNLGGNPDKFGPPVEKGKNKKPIFRPKGWKPKEKHADGDQEWNEYYNVEGWDDALEAVTAAASILAVIGPVVQQFRKAKGEPAIEELDDSMSRTDVPNIPDTVDGPMDIEGLSDNVKLFIGLGIGLPLLAIGLWAIFK